MKEVMTEKRWWWVKLDEWRMFGCTWKDVEGVVETVKVDRLEKWRSFDLVDEVHEGGCTGKIGSGGMYCQRSE